MSSPENDQDGLDQASHQVDEIAGIMKSNIDKVLEREGKLHELDKSACLLEIEATKFESNATKVRRNFWWKNIFILSVSGLSRQNLFTKKTFANLKKDVFHIVSF